MNNKGEFDLRYFAKLILAMVVIYFIFGRFILKYTALIKGNSIMDTVKKAEKFLSDDELKKKYITVDSYIGTQKIEKDIYNKEGYLKDELDVSPDNMYFDVTKAVKEDMPNNTAMPIKDNRKGMYITDIDGNVLYVETYSYKNMTSPIYYFNKLKDKVKG